MSHQPNLFPPDSPDSPQTTERKSPHPGLREAPIWLRRIEIFLYVIVRIYIGVVVLVLPWTPLWSGNGILNYYSAVSTLISLGAVRGLVSGLGLLNLWIAVEEAVHYREAAP